MRFLRLVAVIVPGSRRRAWLEEWNAECAQLRSHLERRGLDAKRVKSQLRDFARGAVPHALWERREGMTMTGLGQDIRIGARSLLRNRGFTAVALVTLMLGVGTTSVLFTLVNGFLLKPPAGVEDAQELVMLGRDYADSPRFDSFSYPNFKILQEQSTTLSGVAADWGSNLVVGSGPDARSESARMVSASYFDVLGVTPILGDAFRTGDGDVAGTNLGVVLSYDYWQSNFQGNPDAIGETLRIADYPLEIIGILPPGFAGIETLSTSPAIFVPLSLSAELLGGSRPEAWIGFDRSWISLFARVADGYDINAVQSEMDRLAVTIQEAHPNNENTLVAVAEGLGLSPEDRELTKQFSLLLLAVSGFVLLITCANLANLLLARLRAREQEVGVRLALGAGRAKLTRLVLVESTLLAVIGAALAIPFAAAVSRALPALIPSPVIVDFALDLNVTLFTLGVALLASLLFGLAPALLGHSVKPTSSLSSVRSGGGSGARATRWSQSGLTVVQIALALVLLSGSTLLTRSLIESSKADVGLGLDDLVLASVSLGTGTGYDEASGIEFFRTRIDELGQLPGFDQVSLVSSLPHSAGRPNQSALREDQLTNLPETPFIADVFSIGPNFFSILDIPLLSGAEPSRPMIDDGGEKEIVVNEMFARELFGSTDVVGQAVVTGIDADSYRIVGVAADVQHRSAQLPPRPAMYFPMADVYESFAYLMVKSSQDQAQVSEAIRANIAAANSGLPVRRVWTGDALRAATMDDTRLLAYLIGAASLLSMVLAAVGLHGVVAFRMARRIREVGIRLAVGASSGRVARGVLQQSARLVLPGVVLGLAGSIALAQALQSALFGVQPWDLTGNVVNISVLALAVVLAGLGPAMHAARIDIIEVLRQD